MARVKKLSEQVETPVQIETVIEETKINPCDNCTLQNTKACYTCENKIRS